MNVIRNPVLMLAWGLPGVAVVASVLSLLLTLRSPDGELPEQYHWEGFQLDRDFSLAAHATELGVYATLGGFAADGTCELTLRIASPAPASLDLLIAHATRPSLDQRVTFARSGTTGHYSGRCKPASDGHWRVELVDATNGWAVRQTIRGPLNGAAIDAVSGTNE